MASQSLIDAALIHRLPPGRYSAAEAARTLISPDADIDLFHAVARRLNHFINEHATPDNARRDACGNAIERKRKKRNQSRYVLLPGEAVARWDASTWKSALRGRSLDVPELFDRLFICLASRSATLSIQQASMDRSDRVEASDPRPLALVRYGQRPLQVGVQQIGVRTGFAWHWPRVLRVNGVRALFLGAALLALAPVLALLAPSPETAKAPSGGEAQLVLSLPPSSAPSWEDDQDDTQKGPSKRKPPLVFSLDIAPDIGE